MRTSKKGPVSAKDIERTLNRGRKVRKDKGQQRNPRSEERKVGMSLSQLRARHVACITQADINRDYREGRIPNYDPEKYGPVCDAPEDPICAAPAVPEDEVREALEEAKNVSSTDQ